MALFSRRKKKGPWKVIPRALYNPAGFRAADGHLVETLKKVRGASRKTNLGKMNRRHIVTGEHTEVTNELIGARRITGTYEHVYHATKGWRVRRTS